MCRSIWVCNRQSDIQVDQFKDCSIFINRSVSFVLLHGLLEAHMEIFPVSVRVTLSATFGVNYWPWRRLIIYRSFFFVQSDLQIPCHTRILCEHILKDLRVHLFNFSLNRHCVLFVASASTVLDSHLIFSIRVAQAFNLSRTTATKNSAHRIIFI